MNNTNVNGNVNVTTDDNASLSLSVPPTPARSTSDSSVHNNNQHQQQQYQHQHSTRNKSPRKKLWKQFQSKMKSFSHSNNHSVNTNTNTNTNSNNNNIDEVDSNNNNIDEVNDHISNNPDNDNDPPTETPSPSPFPSSTNSKSKSKSLQEEENEKALKDCDEHRNSSSSFNSSSSVRFSDRSLPKSESKSISKSESISKSISSTHHEGRPKLSRGVSRVTLYNHGKNYNYNNHDDDHHHHSSRRTMISDSVRFHSSSSSTSSPSFRKTHIYVESSTTGKFFRHALSSKSHQKLFEHNHDNDNASSFFSSSSSPSSSSLSVVKQSGYAKLPVATTAAARMNNVVQTCFHLLQGLLAGFSVQTLYQACSLHIPKSSSSFSSPSEEVVYFMEYYARLANETRRFYFIVSTFCFMIAVIQLDTFRSKTNITSNTKKKTSNHHHQQQQQQYHNVRIWIHNEHTVLMLLHLITLIFVLSVGTMDAQFFHLFLSFHRTKSPTSSTSLLSSSAVAAYFMEITNGDDLDAHIRSWKALCILRSICCIMCWSISNKMQYHYRENKAIMESTTMIGMDDDNDNNSETLHQQHQHGAKNIFSRPLSSTDVL